MVTYRIQHYSPCLVAVPPSVSVQKSRATSNIQMYQAAIAANVPLPSLGFGQLSLESRVVYFVSRWWRYRSSRKFTDHLIIIKLAMEPVDNHWAD